MSAVEDALEALKRGEFVLVFDAPDREGETDLIKTAIHTRPVDISRMRNDGGGLIFMMVGHETSEKLGLPFLSDLFYREGGRYPVLKELIPNDIPYDTKSSFSVPINHRKTFTGITDIDRALTVRRFGEMADEIPDLTPAKAQRIFGQEFRAPGHVAICRSSPHPLRDRFGHTELGVALMTMAGFTPVAVGCEMMMEGKALPPEEASKYGEENGLVFLEGKDILEAWREWSG